MALAAAGHWRRGNELQDPAEASKAGIRRLSRLSFVEKICFQLRAKWSFGERKRERERE